MDNESLPALAGKKAKGFFEHPENSIGIAIPVVAGAFVLYVFGSAIGDYIVSAVDNIFHLVIVTMATLLMLFFALDPKLRAVLFYIYRSMLRWAVGLFVDIDPIGIRETYRDRAKAKLAEMDAGIDKIRGQQHKTKQRHASNLSELEREYGVAAQAQKAGDNRALNMESKQIDRLEFMDRQYTQALAQYGQMLTAMSRYRELCSDTVIDLERDIKFRKEQSEFSKASHNVIGGMKAILKGLPEQDMYDAAGDVLDTQYTNTLGEIEGFMDTTKDILSGANLQDAANVQRVIERLNALEASRTAPKGAETAPKQLNAGEQLVQLPITRDVRQTTDKQ